jgi:dGTPase
MRGASRGSRATTTASGVAKLASLFDGSRLRGTTIPGRRPAAEALSDKGRIVTAKSFRRLQVKAQVFSLEHNAAVRSRLTHTLEVAAMGEIIAGLIVDRIGAPIADVAPAIVATAENACLLHDIGNPPFGHLGEYAIANWFNTHHDEISRRWSNHGISDRDIALHLGALSNFDGNPQGFRTVTRLTWLNDEYGLNLTKSLLASLIKYLGCRPAEGAFWKKVGYFPSERDLIRRIWRDLKLPTDRNGDPNSRHPICFVMEAADDLCYCLSDIDDTIEKRIVKEEAFVAYIEESNSSYLTRILKECAEKQERAKHSAPESLFANFKVQATRELGDRLATLFVENVNDIVEGRLDKPLTELDADVHRATEILREFTRSRVFRSREAVTVELGGFRILTRLLDHYSILLLAGTREFDRIIKDARAETADIWKDMELKGDKLKPSELPLHKRLATLLPRPQLFNYFQQRSEIEGLEPVFRAHLIVDFVAGMTDTHAVKVFNVLEGLAPGEVLP